jgi:uncharacterized protein (UPF0305 family)
MNIFEQASRNKLRFDTAKGQLAAEDLWDLPLTNKGTNLDDIAVRLHAALRDTGVSFVKPASNTNSVNQLRFDIVKHIIDVKMAERDAAAAAADRKQKKDRILELISKKQDQELEGKSLDELTQLANSL